ncbi:methionine ABC transporter permease [Kocuria rhizophila]|uniref:methionine ABC transporter permease n=1 Tax=Kocuria TaxID=57493 RepID=UPI0002F8FDB4|nr:MULTISPECIES: methionine ABC transporter permease [Kocuria]MXN62585.1 ABC transporter permease subunit [Bacillus sp. BGMRC0062]KIC65462.1 methionine ABC transporter ATP-binding protein [Kocuria rhizophila]KMK73507.1 methionine ABC transporter ATP-binding protein [Kocuria rhizophila]KUP28748.1 methionine ABC transporter ATP-binding protein [Kocuria rhizophila]MBO4145332.1 ABC transporter permease [Kocuria rhizophila]
MDWSTLGPQLLQATGQTLYMVSVTLVLAGLLGLAVGVGLYVTRRGNILANSAVFTVLNLLVNFVRPIPFIILLAALGQVTEAVVGTRLGPNAAIFAMTIGATFAVARIVEQNLMTVDPGVVEAARSMGVSRWKIITTVVLPEALGPLVLGYTFLVIGITDMSAMAGAIGAGGLGDFALRLGYQRFNDQVTWAAVIVIIILVQLVQFFGNWLARKIMRR